ncbi:MAG TPA: hypothetical protein VIU85_09325 [Chthoniobacterales bacterium]
MEAVMSIDDAGCLQKRIRELETENLLLRADNKRLRNKLGAAAWRIDGRKGEEFVVELIGGTLTKGSASHDLVSAKGTTFEIKTANLNEAVSGEITNRWVWPHILGANQSKRFDRLLLLGPSDFRYRGHYSDPESPFVIFDVPYEEVRPLLGRSGLIHISTAPPNVRRARTSRTRELLFSRYQTTRKELKKRYSIT